MTINEEKVANELTYTIFITTNSAENKKKEKLRMNSGTEELQTEKYQIAETR